MLELNRVLEGVFEHLVSTLFAAYSNIAVDAAQRQPLAAGLLEVLLLPATHHKKKGRTTGKQNPIRK